MTPRQVQAQIEAHDEQLRARLDRDVAQAWHTARFSRAKRLKPLRHYLQRRRRKTEPLAPPTPTERAQIVMAAHRFRERLLNKRQQRPGPTAWRR